MPANNRPTPQDEGTARQVLLNGLARDDGLDEIIAELAPLHPRYDTFPGEVFLRIAADALDWCGASETEPIPPGGDTGAVPVRVHVPRPGQSQAGVRCASSGGTARRS